MIYTVVTAICFALLSAEILYVILRLCASDRASRIAFIRSFKNGQCVFVYIAAIPLFLIGHLYEGQGTFDAFFNSVSKMIKLVILQYEFESIQALMTANLFYKITVYFCFTLVAVNALLFTFSLTNQQLWIASRAVKSKVTRKNKLIIFGYNQNSIDIYNSDADSDKTLVDDISPQDRLSLYSKKIYYVSTTSFEKHIKRVFKSTHRKNRVCTVIINTESNQKNLLLCRTFTDYISTCADGDRSKLFKRLRIYVFGDPRYETVYGDVVADAYGCIHYVNKFLKTAMEFIDRYPFTRFMDGSQIDYQTSLIKEGVEINVCMIGFGKTNRQIFLTSVANNQFLCLSGGQLRLKPVKYYIFDKDKADNNKNLNHNYYRFKNECMEMNADQYLPLPEAPASEEYLRLDVNDNEFYNKIKRVVSSGKQDANFIIIAFGSDLENIDMAQKLVEKRREWGVNFVIFVKSRALRKEQVFLDNEDCYFFANEREEVYNVSEITDDSIFRMAQMRNEIYDLEYTISHDSDVVIDSELILKNRESANEKWYCVKSQLERESSLYGCLSIRSKLHLMGLDYVKKTDGGRALTEEEYLNIYAKGDLPDTSTYSRTAEGKKIVNYTLDFVDSRRTTMAVHEHQRWNSFMISKGMVPSSIELILNETAVSGGKTRHTNGRNYLLRRHGNITTFEGLVQFRKLISERDGTSELECDVIKYDYQLLDDAWWLLNESGYKIILKSDCAENLTV